MGVFLYRETEAELESCEDLVQHMTWKGHWALVVGEARRRFDAFVAAPEGDGAKELPAEYQEAVGDVLQKALAGQATANFEFPLYTRDGQRVVSGSVDKVANVWGVASTRLGFANWNADQRLSIPCLLYTSPSPRDRG